MKCTIFTNKGRGIKCLPEEAEGRGRRGGSRWGRGKTHVGRLYGRFLKPLFQVEKKPRVERGLSLVLGKESKGGGKVG